MVTKQLQKAFIYYLPKSVLKVTTLCFQIREMAKSNTWNDNGKFSPRKIEYSVIYKAIELEPILKSHNLSLDFQKRNFLRRHCAATILQKPKFPKKMVKIKKFQLSQVITIFLPIPLP